MKANFRGLLLGFLCLAGLIRPVLAMSDRQEIAVGRQAAAEVERRYGVWHDPKWDPILQEIGADLRKYVTRRDLPYTYKLINMLDANAFALPGGFIYVTRGLLEYLQSEGELAAVLSHETSHVELKHFQKMIARENTINLIGLAAMILTGGAARPYLDVAGILNNFVLQPKYSRGQETQADLNGVKLMVEMGRDPYDMIHLFEEFEKHQKRSGWIPLWMQDHPDFPTRIAAVQREIAEYPQVPPPGSRVLAGQVTP